MVLNITIPVGRKKDMIPAEETLKTKESDAVLVAIDNFKKTDMSMNVNKRKTILEVFDKISEIESDNRNIENPDPKSTAKGFFQFNNPSIPTAINRYKNLTNTNPDWLQSLEKNQNIMSLDYDQQRALAIANIAFSEGESINDMNRIAESGQIMNNMDVYNLYKNYHYVETEKKPISSEAMNNAFRKLGIKQ
tara:strand:+ start:66 stop:641 length:576 start_codon:yes stop_codon:yes gene_type:complete